MTSHPRTGSASMPPISKQQRRQGPKDSIASSVSEKIGRMGLRECTAYEAQLRSLLDAAVSEPPPPGVGTAEVEHRMQLLQIALDEVITRTSLLRQEKEMHEHQRYLATQQRRMESEKEAENGRMFEDKHREELVEEIRLAQVAYFKDRNSRDDEKAVQCRQYNDRTQAEALQRATINDSRRARNMENLMEERERHRKELRAKDVARQASIREANYRKATKEEMERREREQAAKIREQETEAKLAAVRESKRSKWVAKKRASRAKSSVVFKNGRAILETETKNHDKLIEDLENKIKNQQARYADERAEQLLYLQQRAQHRVLRQEKQQSNLLRLMEDRLERGEEIVEGARQKKERAEQAKEMQTTQYREHGVELRKDVAKHLKRADEIERQRQERALDKNYRRWNHRAARIIAELNEVAEKDEAAAKQASAAAANGRGGFGDSHGDSFTASLTPSQRFVRLPSPSDFAV